jgi:hypothetical protein
MRTRTNVMAAAIAAGLLLSATVALAQSPSFNPEVPVSAFARPASWLDPSRLQISTEVSVGTGFSGGGAQGLQTTRLSYHLAAPLAMSVSIGNTFGGNRPAFGPNGSGNSMFLEGLDLQYRPVPSMLVQFHYTDVRSPLQYGYGYGYGYYNPWR